MKIKTVIYISFAITISLVILLACLLIYYSSEITRELEKQKISHELVRQTTDLIMVGEEYLVYRYPRTVKQWNIRSNSIKKQISAIAESDISRNLSGNLALLDSSFSKLKENHYMLEKLGPQNAPAVYNLLEERLSGQIRVVSHDMIAGVMKLSEEVRYRIETIQKRSNLAIFIVLFFVITTIALSSYRAVKRIIEPLTSLVRDADIIKGGNLNHKIDIIEDPQSTRRDEIGELSLSFKNMTYKLLESIENLQLEVSERLKVEAELKKAHDNLEQQVEKRTAELSKSNEELQKEIGERKKAETTISKFFEQPMNLHLIAGLDGLIHRVNQGWETSLGYSKNELEGRTFLDFIHPDDQAASIKEMAKLGEGKTTFYFENRYLHKNGSHRLLAWSAIASIEDQTIHAVAKDITERQELEARLQHAQKMESIGTLAGGIAHDFNNILFPIVGNTEMLLEDIPKDSSLRGNLNEVFNAAMRAKDLVKQILAFSRQDSHEIKLMRIQPVIKEALTLIRSTIPASIEIKQTISHDCGIIKADPTQIHQVVMNLATNAYHAMEDTGGVLKVNLKEIELGKQDLPSPDMEPGPYACLIIADSGTGIDDNVIDKIFDPYFTTKEQGKGTGMGLAVIHGIIQNAGGNIQVYSNPNKGTEFHVYLPVVQSSFEQQETQTTELLQRGTEQILLVDDEDAIAFMEKQMLERLGYSVVSRTSSIEALEAFRVNPDNFDLVITDMAMPNMSGDKLASELIKIRSDIPILLCTGFSEKIPAEKAKSMGIKGFLMKPIVIKDLSNMVREMLDNKKGSGEG